MKISTKGRYALRMLLDLAEHQSQGYITLKDIAKRQGISKKYLEQIVIALNQAKFLKSNRGFQGGYQLNKPAKEITVWQILEATEECMSPVACLNQKENPCPRRSECSTLWVWEGLNKVVQEYLKSITIQDLLDCEFESNIDNYII